MPCIGLGTYQSPDAVASAAVKDAMAAGYRLIDTAAAYGNERGVGQGIRISGVPREEIFVTSKLRNAAHGYQATLEAFDMTLSRLGLRYLDLYLIHWPNPIQYRTTWQEATIGTWKAFEELYKAGRIHAIGVSNFMPHHIELLKAHCEILPMVNQLRLCPGVTQPEVVAYCKKNNILVEAYSPVRHRRDLQGAADAAACAEVRPERRPDLPALEHADGLAAAAEVREPGPREGKPERVRLRAGAGGRGADRESQRRLRRGSRARRDPFLI